MPVAKKCCGSCKFCREHPEGIECEENHLDYGDDMNLGSCCDYYEAWELVESTYEKMWNRIKFLFEEGQKLDKVPGATLLREFILSLFAMVERDIKKEEEKEGQNEANK